MKSVSGSQQGQVSVLLPGASIAERQNHPNALRLLAAQRRLYADAKSWRTWRTLPVAGVAVLGVLTGKFAPDALKYVSLLGVLVLVADRIIAGFEKQRTRIAATMQEQFDTGVYPLPWNTFVAGRAVDPEDLAAADRRYKGPRDKLLDWYAPPIGAPYPIDVLLCQRSNLRWDIALRRGYAASIAAVLGLMILAALAVRTPENPSISDFLLIYLPYVPALVAGIDAVRGHLQHIEEQTTLKQRLDVVWDRGLQDPGLVTVADCRGVQDGIYRLRVAAPPVPDWWYWRQREQMESEMRAATDALLQRLQP